MLCCFLSFLADFDDDDDDEDEDDDDDDDDEAEGDDEDELLLLLLLCGVSDFLAVIEFLEDIVLSPRCALSWRSGVLLQESERNEAVAVVAADAEKCCNMRLTEELIEMRLKCRPRSLLLPEAEAAEAERGCGAMFSFSCWFSFSSTFSCSCSCSSTSSCSSTLLLSS